MGFLEYPKPQCLGFLCIRRLQDIERGFIAIFPSWWARGQQSWTQQLNMFFHRVASSGSVTTGCWKSGSPPQGQSFCFLRMQGWAICPGGRPWCPYLSKTVLVNSTQCICFNCFLIKERILLPPSCTVDLCIFFWSYKGLSPSLYFENISILR